MRVIRPRGESASALVWAYVGHTGRQKPHEMHAASSWGSKIPRGAGTGSVRVAPAAGPAGILNPGKLGS